MTSDVAFSTNSPIAVMRSSATVAWPSVTSYEVPSDVTESHPAPSAPPDRVRFVVAWNGVAGIASIASVVAWWLVVGPQFVLWRRVVVVLLLGGPSGWISGYLIPVGCIALAGWTIAARARSRPGTSRVGD